MKKGLGIFAIISLFLFSVPTKTLNEKSIWDDYELVRIEEINKREQPYYIEYKEEAIIVEEAQRTFIMPESEKEGFSWMAEKIKNGSHTQIIVTYQYVYNSEGELLSKIQVPNSLQYYESSEMVYEYGSKPKVGVIFSLSKVTRYGADCGACYPNSLGQSNTASGVPVSKDSVRQADGQWKKGIIYEGYYVVATSRNIPLCTVLEITGHSFSGMGLKPGVPFQAIVLDRGVNDGILDLFVGSEYNLEIVQQTKNKHDYFAEIVAIGLWENNSNNQRVCKIEEGPH